MRIVHKPTGREAIKREGKFRCYPPGEKVGPEGEPFDTIEEAAVFLVRNPGWRIYVGPNGTIGNAQVSRGLIIEGSFEIDRLIRDK